MPTSVRITKRMLDILLSLTVLVLFLPVLITMAILIKLDSPGPVFFKQRRVKMCTPPIREQDTFYMYKFRTMVTDASDHNGDNSIENDPRVTRIGSVLRKMRIDEIPNLINVLIGDMSVVGPRADRYYAMKEVESEFPMIFNRVRYCKPGITGLSQVKLRSNGDMNGNYELPPVLSKGDYGKNVRSFRFKMYYDFTYQMTLTNFWSFLKTDFMIILKTPIVMFFRHNTI